MPLKKGKSKKAMSFNYKAEIAAGKPPRQARAIMLNTAYGPQKKKVNKMAEMKKRGRGRPRKDAGYIKDDKAKARMEMKEDRADKRRGRPKSMEKGYEKDDLRKAHMHLKEANKLMKKCMK